MEGRNRNVLRCEFPKFVNVGALVRAKRNGDLRAWRHRVLGLTGISSAAAKIYLSKVEVTTNI